MRCLGLDDDPAFAELLRIGLEAVGAEGEVHDCKDEFLRRLAACPDAWDTLLIDIELGSESGLDLFPEVRSLSSAPVVFLTGHSAVRLELAGAAPKGSAYHTKPYGFDALVGLLRSVAG